MWCCRAVLPFMIEQQSGTIVNVSSVATRGVNRVPYAAAKGGVNAITASLAWECAGHGIRVVGTAPGGTEAPERRVARGPGANTLQESAWYQQIVDQTVDSSLLKQVVHLCPTIGNGILRRDLQRGVLPIPGFVPRLLP